MSSIHEDEIYEYLANRDEILDFTIGDYDSNIMSSKHNQKNFYDSNLPDCTDRPIFIYYNKGKDNDQMLLTKLRQACAKKGYNITNANELIHQLKKDGRIGI